MARPSSGRSLFSSITIGIARSESQLRLADRRHGNPLRADQAWCEGGLEWSGRRAASSVGERLLHTQEVAGSKPAPPTKARSNSATAIASLTSTRAGTRYGWLVWRKRVHPHLLRHSLGTHRLARGMNPIQLADVLGHSSLRTIQGTYDPLAQHHVLQHPPTGLVVVLEPKRSNNDLCGISVPKAAEAGPR